MKKYTMQCDEEQARVIEDALELYFRIGMAQLDSITQHPLFTSRRYDSDEVRHSLRNIQSLIAPDLQGSYYGIRHEKVPENCKVAHDIRDVIRHRLAWDKNPKGGYEVFYDAPFKTSLKDFILFEEITSNKD